MKRRIILILLIVGILSGAAVGIWWYLRRSTGVRLLARAELAIRAEKFQKALDLADKYVRSHPEDWRGRFAKAQALIRMGRYDDARTALLAAGRLNPSEISVTIMLSECYSLPARRLLARRDTARQPDMLAKVIERFKQANAILLEARATAPKRALDLQQYIGINHSGIAQAWAALAARLDEVADVSRATDLAAAKRKESEAASAESKEAADRAIKTLLDVVRKDASRAVPARVLVELCIRYEDEESLAYAREAIMALESPPPVAAIIISEHEIRREQDPAARREKLGHFCRLLDKLLEKDPEELQVKLARARVAAMLEDSATGERLCKEILDANPGHAEARLIQGMLLMQQGKPAEAEQVLFRLKTDRSRWPAAYFNYALAALAVGKKELATEAMRTVTKLDPDDGPARRYLAESLLRQGFHGQAFADAKEYYRAHPDDPDAVRLFAQTAARTEQPELAKKALEKASGEHAESADMMMVVADGYAIIGDNDKARAAMRRAAECKAATTADRLAVARALIQTGRTPEAEKLLNDELARNPHQPTVRFQLGRLYAATGRSPQAIEEYRVAVRLAGQNVTYRVALARALFDSGDLEECLRVLAQIDAANVDASLLRLEVKVVLDKPVSGQGIPPQAPGAKRAGLSLAMIYLRNGQPRKCVEVCLAELEKTPGDNALRFVLGQAYAAQGQKDKCVEQWSVVLQARPERLSAYQWIAGVLAEELSPEQVAERLAAIPGAKRVLIDLTTAQLLSGLRKFGDAARIYSRLASKATSSESLRNSCQLHLARALAANGEHDRAIAVLDKLAGIKAWQKAALAAKVDVLIGAGRKEQAVAALAQLQAAATDKEDAPILRRIVDRHARMNQVEEALAACDQLAKLLPNDARSYLLRARVLVGAGRSGEALPQLRKAIELQPGNLGTYVTLARMLDREQRSQEARELLKRMEKLGRTGQIAASYERGEMFAQWGLYAQAIEQFQKLAEQHSNVPRLQLALGRAFARLGQKDHARDMLKKVSIYAREYVPARQLLAEIAETDQEKLDILGKLEQAKPGQIGVPMQKMQTLMQAGRPADAVKAFRSFDARRIQNKSALAGPSYLAVHAMLAANDQKAASELASQIAKDTQSSRWKHLAILLSMDSDANAAAGMLPSIEKAGYYDALLGLIVSAQKGDVAARQKWADRFDYLSRQTSGTRRAPLRHRVLVALADGRASQAEAALADAKTAGSVDRNALAEMVTRAGKQAASAQTEATKLLKVSVATDLGLAKLSCAWATEALAARPKCQLAAALAIETRPDAATLKKLLNALQPGDCVLARLTRASLLMGEQKYAEAAVIYGQAARLEKDSPSLLFSQAVATEKAGKFTEALVLYRRILATTQHPTAANNAAYLVSQLHPKDADGLAEAMRWMEAAIKTAPLIPAFRDTNGWLAFLIGKNELALSELRRGIKGLRNSPEAHYHLGVVEGEAGNADLSRWHLEAAVSSAKAIRDDGREPTAAEARAAKLAKEAIDKLGRDQK